MEIRDYYGIVEVIIINSDRGGLEVSPQVSSEWRGLGGLLVRLTRFPYKREPDTWGFTV
jgi:hypothetical protein